MCIFNKQIFYIKQFSINFNNKDAERLPKVRKITTEGTKEKFLVTARFQGFDENEIFLW